MNGDWTRSFRTRRRFYRRNGHSISGAFAFAAAEVAAEAVTLDRYEALALGAFAAGVAVIVFYVIPRIEIAIAGFDLLTGGM